MKFAVIDIGSNSVRLLISNNNSTEYKESKITGLAKNMLDNSLERQAVKRTLSVVSFFIDKAKSYGAQKILCFATQAVRMAINKELIILPIKENHGIDLDVVSGDIEAYLGLLGALEGRDGGVIDIGGASTEIIVKKENKIIYKKSLPIGVVSLTNNFMQNKDKIAKFCTKMVNEFDKISDVEFTGIGGTCLCATAMNLALEKYEPKITHGSRLCVKELNFLIDKVYSLKVEDRINIKGLQKGREEVIGSGLIWLATIMKHLNIEYITLSEKDNLEGYLINYLKKYE